MAGKAAVVAPLPAQLSPARPPAPPAPHAGAHKAARFWPLAVGAVGVVFGDIGTSPLYAFRLALNQVSQHEGVRPEAIFGVVSLALWALILVVTVKYVLFLMRADNKG